MMHDIAVAALPATRAIANSDQSDAYGRFLDTLRAYGSTVREVTPDKAAATCPAHDDHHPSLDIKRAEGTFVMVCRAGCDNADVLAALRLTDADFYDHPAAPRRPDVPRPARNGKAPRSKTRCLGKHEDHLWPRETARYAYHDECGTLLGWRRRFPCIREGCGGKRFQWLLPDGTDKGPTDPPIYRLPEILAAIAAGRTIYITEGEKDADALVAIGEEATTTGSAGSWKPRHTEMVRGAARVVVCQDRDEPGRKSGASIVRLLTGAVGSVRVVEAAEGKDVHDHLAAGRPLTELVDILGEEEPASPHAEATKTLHDYMVDGASFILDAPETIPALWGRDGDVLWAKGEALMIAGGNGVGKTTVAAQIVRARLGLQRLVLGFPVEPTASRVLYLAMDRPEQCRRALGRLFRPSDREVLAERLVFWKGPPPADIAKHTDVLLEMCQDAGADTVIVDSLKDAAIGLSEDEVGAGYNRARQKCLAAGVEVLELHHNVKRGANGTAPTSISDVYGSTWLTSGAGSVIGLHGEPGDLVVQLRHLKQPMNDIGPLTLIHDHATGVTQVEQGVDLLDLARRMGSITAQAGAVAIYGADKPSPNQVEKIRYRLDKLTREGLLEKAETTPGKPAIYNARGQDRGQKPMIVPGGQTGQDEVRRGAKPAGQRGQTRGQTGQTPRGSETPPPLEGEESDQPPACRCINQAHGIHRDDCEEQR